MRTLPLTALQACLMAWPVVRLARLRAATADRLAGRPTAGLVLAEAWAPAEEWGPAAA
jgi:hypothetical protein